MFYKHNVYDSSIMEKPKSLIEAMRIPDAPDWFYEKDFPLPDRKQTKHREFSFQPDDE